MVGLSAVNAMGNAIQVSWAKLVTAKAEAVAIIIVVEAKLADLKLTNELIPEQWFDLIQWVVGWWSVTDFAGFKYWLGRLAIVDVDSVVVEAAVKEGVATRV